MPETRIRGGHRIKAALSRARRARGVRSVKVGFFRNSRYQDGTPVAAVALWNEFGFRSKYKPILRGEKVFFVKRKTPKKIPERPFMRQGIRRSRDPVLRMIKRDIDPKELVIYGRLANRIGAVIAGEIQRRISNLRKPSNAPVTVLMKKSSNPLVGSGKMRQSVAWRVQR